MLTASTVNHYPTLHLTDEQLQRIHDAELEAYEARMNDDSQHLEPRDRQFLIAGLIGEYQYLCHDDPEIDEMTPAEHHALLVNYTDAELIEDSDIVESPYETAEEFYDTHSSFCPYEYQVQ